MNVRVHSATPPSTIDGIKRLAKRLSRGQQIPHNKALIQASRTAGFENYVHAQRVLSTRQTVQAGHTVYISAFWTEKIGSDNRWGLATVGFMLPRLLPDIVTTKQMLKMRELGCFKQEFADHLEHMRDITSEEAALRSIMAAGRALRVLAATGLRPCTTKAHQKATMISGELPDKDHQTDLMDLESGDWIVLDEPYARAIGHRGDRVAWAASEGLTLVDPEWEGMYFPSECKPSLLGRNKDLVARVATALERLEPAPTSEQMEVIRGDYNKRFASPLRLAAGKSQERRPGSWYSRKYGGAVSYGNSPGIESRWRPDNMLPKATHERLGKLLSSVSTAGLSSIAYKHVLHIRSELDDWSWLEHKSVKTDAMDFYYSSSSLDIRGREAVLKALSEIRSLLAGSYQECAPKRRILATVDKARISVESSLLD